MVEVHLLHRESIVIDETDMSNIETEKTRRHASAEHPTGAPAPNAKPLHDKTPSPAA
jgi:hypothetical protein